MRPWLMLFSSSYIFLACAMPRAQAVEPLPLIHSDDFERDWEQRWQTTDDEVWRVVSLERDGKVMKALRVTGKSAYQPPVRSPHSIAWLKNVFVGDFELTVRAANTNVKAGGHRDLCLFWGRQDASHFYYVHFGAVADPHSCQIFLVDGKPRTKITTKEASGTDWGPATRWHTLRVVRTTKDGLIRVYFDDLKQPHLVARDNTFLWGQVGLGTFDDNGNFAAFELRGTSVQPPKREVRGAAQN